MSRSSLCLMLLLGATFAVSSGVAAGPGEDEVKAALDRACTFYHEHCSKHGGYVWRYSKDLTLSEGEGETGPDSI